MTRISRYFDLQEFLVSQAAARMGLKIEPTKTIVASLTALAKTVLDPLREELGRPVHITSGYRTPEVNALIGGSRRSQHMAGEAADIVCKGVTPVELATIVKRLGLPIDQCIVEFDQWLHVSHKEFGPQRGEYLRAVSVRGDDDESRTVYHPLW